MIPIPCDPTERQLILTEISTWRARLLDFKHEISM